MYAVTSTPGTFHDVRQLCLAMGSGWDLADARTLLSDLTAQLPARNPGALKELQDRLEGQEELEALQARVLEQIERADATTSVVWQPHGTRTASPGADSVVRASNRLRALRAEEAT